MDGESETEDDIVWRSQASNRALPLLSDSPHQLDELFGIRQFHSSGLGGLTDPALDGAPLRWRVFAGVAWLMDVGPGRLDAAGSVDGIFLIGRISKAGLAVFADARTGVDIGPATDPLWHTAMFHLR